MAMDGTAGTSALPLRLIVGHYAVYLLSACIAAVVLLDFRPPPPGPVYLVVSIGLVAAVIGTFLALRAHDRRLCELCMGRMPLNPADKAAGLRNRFWLIHRGAKPIFVVAYLGLIAGSNFLSGVAGRMAWAALTLSLIYPLLAYDAHRRFQPWCPWCSDNGGGGHDTVDTPDPSLPSLSSH